MTAPEVQPSNASPAPSSEDALIIPEKVQALSSPASGSPSQRRTSWAERITAAFPVVHALATLALVVAAIVQHGDTLTAIQVTNRFAKAAEDYANESKRLADAASQQAQFAERTSVSSRPWIFLIYSNKFPDVREYVGGHTVGVEYELHNYGLTPAMIKNIEIHIFAGEREPDPVSPDGRIMQENNQMPGVSRTGIAVSVGEDLNSYEHIIPAQGSIVNNTEFHFFRSNKAFTIFGLPHSPLLWLFCVIKYSDVYGYDRETSYYAQIGFGKAAQPEPAHRRYNYWK